MVRKTPSGRDAGGVLLLGGDGFSAPSHMMVCAVPMTVGCREVRGRLAHCAPHRLPWRGEAGAQLPRDSGGRSRRGPDAHRDPAGADGQGEGRRRQQLVPPASGSPAAAGVRGGDGSEWQKPSLLSPPPSTPQPSSLALQEASPQIPCLGGQRAQVSEPGLTRWKSQPPASLAHSRPGSVTQPQFPHLYNGVMSVSTFES